MQAQKRWDDFTSMKYEMLKRSHSSSAPWTVIRSIDKHKARFNVLKLIPNAVDYDDHSEALDFVTDDKVVISGAREIEIMNKQRLKKGRFIG